MDFITILFIGIGLAMDASAVSLAKGMGLDKDQVKKYAFILALAFGLFKHLCQLLDILPEVILPNTFNPSITGLPLFC